MGRVRRYVWRHHGFGNERHHDRHDHDMQLVDEAGFSVGGAAAIFATAQLASTRAFSDAVASALNGGAGTTSAFGLPCTLSAVATYQSATGSARLSSR